MEGQFYPEYGYPRIPMDKLPSLLISFIEACPLLHTFKLELWPMLQHAKLKTISSGRRGVKNKYEMRKHDQLKVLEIVGFDESATLADFVFCITQNAPMLKKIICDPHCPRSDGGYLHNVKDNCNIDKIALARRQAKWLAQQIQEGIDVVVL
uniref:At1g61320/AtMIF1 LRR domain-containing protein n=1 Tax=Chenopodium quinoa TaxID=63459 RepID=A0A803LNQ6_CHEQI